MNYRPWVGLSFVSLAAVAAFATGTSFAQNDAALNSELPYRAEMKNPVTYSVDFSAVVTPPYDAKVLRVWLPLPQTDAGQQVTEGEIAAFPMDVKPQIAREPVYGNQFAYFEFDHPEGAQVIRHQFTVKVSEMRWNVDPAKVTRVGQWPASFDRYRKGDEQAVMVNDRVTALLHDAVPERRGEAQDLASVMSWVNKKMKYDHKVASLQANSMHLIDNGRGHCSDYHSLCASMGRALGYPTRVTYGINPFPKNSPSHCKLEAFLPPYGWVSFDVSETQRLIEEIHKNESLSPERKDQLVRAAEGRLIGGFRDNTWFLQTRGSDYDLAPPASRRVPVVRTIYAEADGVALPEPDPANSDKREFSWMTVHKFVPDHSVAYPFKEWKSLETQP
jgi:transglutaminase-like putative cysteine protease